MPTPDAAHEVAVRREVTYRETPERDLALDVFVPSTDVSPPTGEDDRRPAVVLVHGGGWRGGGKGQFARWALDLASEGFVAVELNYRLSHEAAFPACVVDVKAGVRWLRANADEYGVDPGRIGAVGHSAGAHLAVLAAVTADRDDLGADADPPVSLAPDAYPERSSQVQAVVAFDGAYDLVPDGFEDFEEVPEEVRQLFGGPYDERPRRYRLGSPARHATSAAPPTLLVHAEGDEVCPFEQSAVMHDALDAAGADSELHPVESRDHAFLHSSFHYDDAFDRTATFLSSHL